MIVPGSTIDQEYMDIADAGRYIGIVKAIAGDPDPARTLRRQLQRLYHMVHRKTIPFYKKGKQLYFSKTALDDWMQSGRNGSYQSHP